MKINKKIKILIILVTIAFILVAIGISANSLVNQKSEYQKNNCCTNNEDCSKSYSTNEKESINNCRLKSNCEWRT